MNFTLRNIHHTPHSLSLIAIAGVTPLLLSSCQHEKQDKQPNIILIMTDDHTTQAIGCYGSRLGRTPNIDRIANEGIQFNNCYVSNAISGPSRACIMTGKMSHINGFTDNSRTFDGDQETFPKLLQHNGYQTAIVGKWHLNSTPQGFDFWSVLIGQGEYYNPDFIENGKTVTIPGYVTDIITDKSIQFLKDRDTSKPFAMMVYHKAPHRNWMPAERHLGVYNDTLFPEPETLFDDYATLGTAAREQMMTIAYDMWEDQDLKIATPEQLEGKIEARVNQDANKEDVSRANQKHKGLEFLRAGYNRMTSDQKASWNRAYQKRIEEHRTLNLSGERLVSWKYQQYMRDYLATTLSVDESIGTILKYLEDIGELDNTIIIYTSDQGFFLGEHGWFDKRLMYEECHRTPLVIRFPTKIKAGSKSHALSMNIDFAPTILDYAQIDIPQAIQGRSLRPILENQGQAPHDWRKAVYYHYYEYPSWHMVKRHYGIRTNEYKLIHFYNNIDQWELYDLRKNSTESRNVYNDPQYATVQKELHQLLLQTQQEYKDLDPTEQTTIFFKSE